MPPTDKTAALLEQAVALHHAGKIDQAERLYDQILRTTPGHGDALHLKGVIASDRGNYAQAIALFDRALAVLPKFPEARFNRANALAALERDAEALAAFAEVIALRPDYGDAYVNAGRIHHKLGRRQQAAAVFRAMTATCPGDPRGFFNFGVCLTQLIPEVAETKRGGIADEALAALERALALQPRDPETHYALGNLHAQRGDHAKAIHHVRIAIDLRPDWSAAWNNLGSHLESAGDRVDAIAAFDRALALEVKDKGAVVNRGLTLLALGRFGEGWEGYSRRFEDPRFPFTPRPWPWPAWQGEDLSGKRILLWSDQSIGDEILYSGMIGEMTRRAATCVVECAPRLLPLYRRSFPAIEIMPNSPEGHAALLARSFDFQCSILDVGRWLRLSWSAFPNRSHGLKADSSRTAALRADYLEKARGKKLVGLSWHSTNPRTGAEKSMDFRTFLQFGRADLMFVNIQYGPAGQAFRETAGSLGLNLITDDRIDGLKDLDAWAAQINALDMVATISNSAAHLAGALGVPTCLHVPGGRKRLWYWFDTGGFSPWYRSLRIFRDSADSFVREAAAIAARL